MYKSSKVRFSILLITFNYKRLYILSLYRFILTYNTYTLSPIHSLYIVSPHKPLPLTSYFQLLIIFLDSNFKLNYLFSLSPYLFVRHIGDADVSCVCSEGFKGKQCNIPISDDQSKSKCIYIKVVLIREYK